MCYSTFMATETQLDYNERIEQVKRYIREHVDEPINWGDLARLVGFSVPHVLCQAALCFFLSV